MQRLEKPPSLLRATLESIDALARTQPPTRKRTPLTLASFVLRHAQAYVSQRLSDEERALVLDVAKRCRDIHGPFEFRQCYVNSQRALMLDRSKRLYYVEGYVMELGHHTLHGWLAIHGKVVDFTALPPDPTNLPAEPPQILGEFAGREYLGIPFRRAYVRSCARATEGFGTLIDDWERGFPLFRTVRRQWLRTT